MQRPRDQVANAHWPVSDCGEHEPQVVWRGPPAPAWPKVKDDGCERVGCGRPGTRTETLTVKFEAQTGHAGSPWSCSMDDLGAWQAWAVGDTATLLVGGVLGGDQGDQVRASPLTRTMPPPLHPGSSGGHEQDQTLRMLGRVRITS